MFPKLRPVTTPRFNSWMTVSNNMNIRKYSIQESCLGNKRSTFVYVQKDSLEAKSFGTKRQTMCTTKTRILCPVSTTVNHLTFGKRSTICICTNKFAKHKTRKILIYLYTTDPDESSLKVHEGKVAFQVFYEVHLLFVCRDSFTKFYRLIFVLARLKIGLRKKITLFQSTVYAFAIIDYNLPSFKLFYFKIEIEFLQNY